MKKILLSLMITLILISPVWANKLDERQLKEIYATKAMTSEEVDVHNESASAHANRFTNYSTTSQMNSAIADATAAIIIKQTISVTAGENLSVGDIVSLINTNDSITAVKNDRNYTQATSTNTTITVSGTAVVGPYILEMGNNRIAVFYGDSTANIGRVAIIKNANTTPTLETGYPFTFEGTKYPNIKAVEYMDSGKAFISYARSDNGYIYGCVVTGLSGTSPGVETGSPFAILSASNDGNCSATYIGSGRALVGYCSYSDYDGTVNVITGLTAANPTVGATGWPIKVQGTDNASNIEIEYLGGNRAIAVFYNTALYGAKYSIIKGTDGTSPSLETGSPYSLTGDNPNADGISAVTAETGACLVAFAAGSNGTRLYKIKNLTTSSPSVETGYPLTLSSANNKAGADLVYNSATGKGAVLFAVTGDIYFVGGLTGTSPNLYNSTSYIPHTYCYNLAKYSDMVYYTTTASSGNFIFYTITHGAPYYNRIRGICSTATSNGQSATIVLNGLVTGLSNIVTGSQYWLQSDFSMGTAPVSLAIMKNSSTQTGEIYLGTGASSSTLYFGVDYK